MQDTKDSWTGPTRPFRKDLLCAHTTKEKFAKQQGRRNSSSLVAGEAGGGWVFMLMRAQGGTKKVFVLIKESHCQVSNQGTVGNGVWH